MLFMMSFRDKSLVQTERWFRIVANHAKMYNNFFALPLPIHCTKFISQAVLLNKVKPAMKRTTIKERLEVVTDFNL